MWFSRLLHAAVLQQVKSLRIYFLLCLFWVRVVTSSKPPPHPTMNSPFVNFKLKPGISRSLTGAALFLSAAALINAGEAKADLSCTLSSLSSCNGVVGDKTFSGFNLAGYTGSGTISISEYLGIWTVQTLFNPATTGVVNGTLKYNVAITDPVATFDQVAVNVNGSSGITAGNPGVSSTISGANNDLPFSADAVSPPSVETFVSGTKTIAVSQKFTASGGRRLSAFTTDFTQQVPAPLPLLGAGAAFGFSRRLRSRIKTSAAA